MTLHILVLLCAIEQCLNSYIDPFQMNYVALVEGLSNFQHLLSDINYWSQSSSQVIQVTQVEIGQELRIMTW